MEKAEEVSARMTTATPEEYSSQDIDWGFTDYRQGVVYFWAQSEGGLPVAMQEWALRHPDRFASVKAMAAVSEGCIFILYTPLAEKATPGLIRGLQQCFMQASSKEASATKSEEASATDTMPAEHDV